MRPSGAHTHPGMSGGGNGWPVITGLILLAAIAGPVAHAVTGLIKALAITAAILAGLALTALAAGLTYRARKAKTAPLRIRVLPVAQPRQLEGAQALERAQEVHLHFHGISTEEAAAILDRVHAAAGDPARAPGREITQNPGRPGLTGRRYRDPRSGAPQRQGRPDAYPGRNTRHD